MVILTLRMIYMFFSRSVSNKRYSQCKSYNSLRTIDIDTKSRQKERTNERKKNSAMVVHIYIHVYICVNSQLMIDQKI